MSLSIKEIKEIFLNSNIDDLPELIKKFSDDHRAGVKKIISAFQKKYSDFQNELIRVQKLNEYENLYFEHGLEFIGGIDEVGRGPLAGPVAAACVILPKGTIIPYINDSKKLSPAKRNELSEIIKQKAIDIGIGIVDNNIIDEINILNATHEAMRLALKQMKTKPDFLLIDALRIPRVSIPQQPIIKGDSLSISIAAASIMAKITRDSMMDEYAVKYPYYDFENNKGYGTQKHLDGIKKHGICSLHRKSFLKSIDY